MRLSFAINKTSDYAREVVREAGMRKDEGLEGGRHYQSAREQEVGMTVTNVEVAHE